MKKLTIGLGVVLLVVMSLFLISSIRKPAKKTFQTSKSLPTPTQGAKNPLYTPGKQTFVIFVKNWDFNPTHITVKQGDRVVLKVKSMDIEHGISIPVYNISESLPSFKVQTIEFTANKKGSFAYICTKNCGPKSALMKGTITVE
ncbi:cupredoxin domain-containing protein [Candidatus Microgenomates bacterium]|nr:cupredoxin domain-containing protein [Candidatus Microgenomates bacterium]